MRPHLGGSATPAASFYCRGNERDGILGPRQKFTAASLLIIVSVVRVASQCPGDWDVFRMVGSGFEGVSRSGLALYSPAEVTICTAEYTPFVFLRESAALVRYSKEQTLESVAALASGGLGGEWKAVASEERITSNTTIHEFVTLHPSLFSFIASFQGMDVELMRAISVYRSKEFSLYDTRFQVILKRSYPDALWGAKVGECDMAMGGYTRTAARSQCPSYGPHKCNQTSGVPGNVTSKDVCCLTWSQPYQKTGVSFLTRQSRETGWIIARRHILTPLNMSIMSLLAISLIVSGHLIWLTERHENPHMFPPAYLDGVDDGIWWSLVTMTTVGYGDKVPTTMTGRFLAFLWMMVGLITFAFFTSAVSSIVHEIQGDKIWHSAAEIQSRIDNREIGFCTVRGVFEDIFPEAGDGAVTANNVDECYASFKDSKEVAIAFDRPALVYDVQQSLLATPPSVTPLDEVDKASNGYYWLSSSVRGQGVVISEPLRSTYAAVAYPVPPRINLEKLDHEGWVSIPDMINQALNFIMYYEGGIYIDTGATDEDTNISGEIPPLDSGWSIADSRAQWLPRELEENKAIPFESMDPGDSTWTDTSTILGTAAVIIMTAYVIAQFGGLYLRRQRKIRRIQNGISTMPSGFDKPSDLPFYYNEKSTTERANDALKEEMLRVRNEIDSLKGLLSKQIQARGSQPGTPKASSFRTGGRGGFFGFGPGVRRKTVETKSNLDPGCSQTDNALGRTVNFTPELTEPRRSNSHEVSQLAAGSSRTMRKAISSGNERAGITFRMDNRILKRSSSGELPSSMA